MRTTLIILGTFMFMNLTAQVEFQNVSTAGSLDYQGRTYGSSWGDINGDGLMDLYLSCHQNKAEPFYDNDSIRIYLNMGESLFDMTIYALDDGGQSDFHGAAFIDLDNDGDKDMLLMTGGTKKNVFYRNDGTTQLVDIADAQHLALNKSRGRQSTYMDINHDGFTDILINNEQPINPIAIGSALMIADPGSPYVLDSSSGLIDQYSSISCISDLNGDNQTDLVVANFDSLNFYSIGTNGELTLENHLNISNINDINVADFNGDLLPDIFIARGLTQETDIAQFNDSAIYASNELSSSLPPCYGTFVTEGPIVVSLLNVDGVPFNVLIGNDSSINNIISLPGQPYNQFTLDPDSSFVYGFQFPSSLTDVECSFGLQANNLWTFKLINNTSAQTTVIMTINSSAPISDFTSSGTPTLGEESRDLLLLNQGNYQFTASTDPAFNLDEISVNVTSGDFDNDMDNDLYVVATGRAKNRKDHIYENLGDGSFAVHENGWGTKGDVAGLGDGVTKTDFNNDGFLDLFVTNGSTSFFLDSAGIDLYKNLGNSNNWITLDLNGVESNADGLGARVILEANGISQVGDMTGGIHAACQDDDRVHFGLGNATIVDAITVYWPSGMVDQLNDVAVDQILTITEGDFTIGVGGPGANNSALPDLSSIDHVIIYNALGQPVQRTHFEKLVHLAQDDQLGAGLYLVTYVNKFDQVVLTKKLVKY